MDDATESDAVQRSGYASAVGDEQDAADSHNLHHRISICACCALTSGGYRRTSGVRALEACPAHQQAIQQDTAGEDVGGGALVGFGRAERRLQRRVRRQRHAIQQRRLRANRDLVSETGFEASHSCAGAPRQLVQLKAAT